MWPILLVFRFVLGGVPKRITSDVVNETRGSVEHQQRCLGKWILTHIIGAKVCAEDTQIEHDTTTKMSQKYQHRRSKTANIARRRGARREIEVWKEEAT